MLLIVKSSRFTLPKSIPPQTRRAVTIPRPPLESSQQEESRCAVSIFVRSIFGLSLFETCESKAQTKIDTVDLDSPRRIFIRLALIPFRGPSVCWEIDFLVG